MIEGYSRKQHYWVAVILLLGVLFLLSACSPAPTATPVPTPDCPVVTPETLESFDEVWKASPHADEEAEAFRHWDAADPQEIPVGCAKCHSRTGFVDFLGVDGTAVDVVDAPAKIGTTISCFTCHNEATYTLDSVTFPSGKRIGGLGRETVCISCHEGRSSTMAVNIAITTAGVADDVESADIAFINSHATSAATPFGSEAAGAYEYNGEVYKGRFTRGDDFFSCTRCHDQHSLEVKTETCSECHTFDGIDARNIRVNTTDFDGDGNITEGVAYEVEALHTALLSAIQAYALNTVGVPIAYDAATHPYFFTDINQNGVVDPEEAVAENEYSHFTPRLLRAAYNYNYAWHDAGAYAHNSTYILQVLYDSLADIGGDISGMTRP